MKPRYVVQKAPDVGGDPIPEDEYPLVIRVQDKLAPQVLDFYMREYCGYALPAPDPGVIAELTEHQRHVHDWQAAHPDKVKWADR